MAELFTQILSQSIAAGIAAVLVVLIILVFRRLPGYARCILWSLVGLRLILPFSLTEPLAGSLTAAGADTASDTGGVAKLYRMAVERSNEVLSSFRVPSGGNIAEGAKAVASTAGKAAMPTLSAVLLGLWLLGAVAMLAVLIISYTRLSLKLRTATSWGEGIYQSECIASPFVFGLFRPRIYMPYYLKEQDIPYVLAHERTHIKRKDHLVKAAAMAVLSIHWFNPLLWLAFKGLCRDIELACDEQVILGKPRAERQRYSTVLLSYSIPRSISLCPVSFGEVGVKERILNIMKNNTPKTITKLFSLLICLITAISILALPVGCGKSPVASGAVKSAQSAEGLSSYVSIISDSVEEVEVSPSSFIFVAEDISRLAESDGSVIMFYNAASNCATDLLQELVYTSGTGDFTAAPQGGTLMQTDENGRLNHLAVPSTINAAEGSSVFWIPTECETEGEPTNRQVKRSTVTFTSNDGSDTAAVTITVIGCFSVSEDGKVAATAYPGDAGDDVTVPQLIYSITVDESHTLTVNEDKSITINQVA